MEGSPVVTTIYGPWNEPYLRDLQGTEFEFETGTEAIASAIANKRKYIANKECDTKPVPQLKTFNYHTGQPDRMLHRKWR